MDLLGLPVEVDESMPPGVVKLRALNGDEITTAVSVEWIYEAHAKMPAVQRRHSRWVVRRMSDVLDPLAREGVTPR